MKIPIRERVAWHEYEKESKRSARMEFLANVCMIAVILSLGVIPIRAILPQYAQVLMTLPKTDAGAVLAIWTLSKESIIPLLIGLILSIYFGLKIETPKDFGAG